MAAILDLEARMTLKVQNIKSIIFVILKLVGIDPSFVFVAHLTPGFRRVFDAITRQKPVWTWSDS